MTNIFNLGASTLIMLEKHVQSQIFVLAKTNPPIFWHPKFISFCVFPLIHLLCFVSEHSLSLLLRWESLLCCLSWRQFVKVKNHGKLDTLVSKLCSKSLFWWDVLFYLIWKTWSKSSSMVNRRNEFVYIWFTNDFEARHTARKSSLFGCSSN